MSDPTLAHVLASDELGAWSLGIDALEFLRRQITDLKPQVVLEFGSGISTVCLARFMSLASDDARMLVSLEQDSAQATLSRNRLAGVPVSVDVRVHDAPLEVKTFEGAVFHAYRVDDLGRLLEGHKANLVLIDGPAAEAGARVCTVPSVLPFLQEGAWFFMDDALRPSEIWAARRWASDPRLDIDGVVLVGKGLLVGRVKDARPSNQSS
jgi:predicted O-methyltransferase YrrM